MTTYSWNHQKAIDEMALQPAKAGKLKMDMANAMTSSGLSDFKMKLPENHTLYINPSAVIIVSDDGEWSKNFVTKPEAETYIINRWY